MAYRKMSLLGFYRWRWQCARRHRDVVADLLAEQVWHVGLFIVATGAARQRRAAPRSTALLERWMVDQGAHWLRLGVVRGSARAERFWCDTATSRCA